MSKDWRKAVVDRDITIQEALEVINEEALGIVFVVDGDMVLNAVITDGDIRRGLLNGKTLSDKICTIQNDEPKVSSLSEPNDILIERMVRFGIRAIPIVEDRKLVAVKTLDDLLESKEILSPVFIMAGGFGTRLKPLTDSCPKPMLKVGDKPMLETMINGFKRQGFKNFYISTHYLPNVIVDHFKDGKEFGVNIKYVNESEPLGTGGALGLLPKNIEKGPIIVINGDILTDLDFSKLIQHHLESHAAATMCVRSYDYRIPYGVVSGEGGYVKEFIEKPTYSYNINAGIYVLEPNILDHVESGNYVDLPEILKNISLEGQKVSMFPIHSYWLDIGRMEDFEKAQLDIISLGI